MQCTLLWCSVAYGKVKPVRANPTTQVTWLYNFVTTYAVRWTDSWAFMGHYRLVRLDVYLGYTSPNLWVPHGLPIKKLAVYLWIFSQTYNQTLNKPNVDTSPFCYSLYMHLIYILCWRFILLGERRCLLWRCWISRFVKRSAALTCGNIDPPVKPPKSSNSWGTFKMNINVSPVHARVFFPESLILEWPMNSPSIAYAQSATETGYHWLVTTEGSLVDCKKEHFVLWDCNFQAWTHKKNVMLISARDTLGGLLFWVILHCSWNTLVNFRHGKHSKHWA